MINENEWIVVGLITSPHGINGKVKVKSLSDFEEDSQSLGQDGYRKTTKLLLN